MLFSSIPFLFYFLPIVLILYFAVPKKLKNTVLLLSSLFFYGWGEPKFLIFMLISITQGYVFGLLIEKYQGMKRSKVFLVASVVFSLSILGYYKYADFFIENFNALTGMSVPLLRIALPIGISFYTFQILSYAVDVYRQDTKAQRNFINLAAYISMFPQLIAGPIVRYSDIAQQLENRTHSFEKAALGVRRFVMGLSKKILLANLLGEVVAVFKESSDSSVLFCWIYAFSYMLHVYFDFSGYSDMAIGLGKIFGFDFLENFNYPFVSSSVTEFWRRWHMSLGSWFRDYVYIPLGGNRKGVKRTIINTLIVWSLTGLWHGAAWNFIAWGMFYGVLLIAEKYLLQGFLEKLPKAVKYMGTMAVVMLGWVFFASGSLGDALSLIGSMSGFGGSFIDPQAKYLLSENIFLIFVMSLSAIGVFEFVSNHQKGKTGKIVEGVGYMLIFALSVAYLISETYNPFLYFRF